MALGSQDRESTRRLYVASAIADDYEQLQQTESDLRRCAEEDGIPPFTAEELLEEIRDLIRDGYAAAYVLSTKPPHVSPVIGDLDTGHQVWYWLTRDGVRLLNQLRAAAGRSG